MSSEPFTILDYCQKPMPFMDEARDLKRKYQMFPIRVDQPLFDEHGINLKDVGIAGENYYWEYTPKVKGAIPDLIVRATVANLLVNVNRCLYLHNLMLFVRDAYRPLEVQRFVEQVSVRSGLRKENPDISEQELDSMVHQYAARSDDPDTSLPPHLTGGAVDVELRDPTNKPIEMGKGVGKLYSCAFPDHFEKLQRERTLSGAEQQALLNRRLLYWLMTDAGFVINPTEWWHYSFGDQMWAKLSGKPAALYSKLRI